MWLAAPRHEGIDRPSMSLITCGIREGEGGASVSQIIALRCDLVGHTAGLADISPNRCLRCCLRPMRKPRHPEQRTFRCSLALPIRTATDASPAPSREPTHGSRRNVVWLLLRFRGLSPPTFRQFAWHTASSPSRPRGARRRPGCGTRSAPTPSSSSSTRHATPGWPWCCSPPPKAPSSLSATATRSTRNLSASSMAR